MKCPKCKKEIKAEAFFCTQCGLNLRETWKVEEKIKEVGQELEEKEVSFDGFVRGYENRYAYNTYEYAYGNDTYKDLYGSNSNGEAEDEWDPYTYIMKKKQKPKEVNEKTILEEKEQIEEGVEPLETEEENDSKEERSEDSDEEVKQRTQEEIKETKKASSEKKSKKKKGGKVLLFLFLIAAVGYGGIETIGEPPVQVDLSISGNESLGDELFPVTVKEEMNKDELAREDSTSVPTATFLDEMPFVDSSKRIEVISAYATSVIAQEGTTNEPIKVFDQKIDTNWQEGVSGPGIGQGFTAGFRNSEKVRYLTFMLGNWKTDRYYYGNNRPKTLTLELGTFKTQVTFPDEWKEFYVEISPACEAASLNVIIDEVYAGSNWDDTPVTDISLFRE